jgi:hypothetical protein
VNSQIHADIDALKGLHAAVTRFRQVMRDVADRGDDQIEITRASLEAKAGQLRSRLEQCQAELDACRARVSGESGEAGGYGGSLEDYRVDCSGYARAVTEVTERLEQVRRWQQRIDQEAGEFRGTADRFRDRLETDLPRTEGYLVTAIGRLQAARRVL